MANDIDGAAAGPGAARRYERIGDLYEVASMLLEGLDELGIHDAAAYVSMAQRRIQERHPVLALQLIDGIETRARGS